MTKRPGLTRDEYPGRSDLAISGAPVPVLPGSPGDRRKGNDRSHRHAVTKRYRRHQRAGAKTLKTFLETGTVLPTT
jgi:hypothetical protein